jgi:hypothetical protein
MENKKDRFNRACEYLKYKREIANQQDIADKMGASRSNVSSASNGKTTVLTDRFLERFNEAFGNMFNIDWLKNGHGEMLTHPISTIINGVNVVNGNNSGHISQVNAPSAMPNTPIEDAEAVCLETGAVEGEAVEFLPVVPAKLAQLPHEDTWAYINQNPVPRQPVVMQFPDYHTTLQVRSDAMAPRLRAGDTVALRHMGPNPKIMNGEVYGFDTRDGGLVIREGTNIPGGYRLHARSERYADDVLMYEEVLNVYEVVGAVIMNI